MKDSNSKKQQHHHQLQKTFLFKVNQNKKSFENPRHQDHPWDQNRLPPMVIRHLRGRLGAEGAKKIRGGQGQGEGPSAMTCRSLDLWIFGLVFFIVFLFFFVFLSVKASFYYNYFIWFEWLMFFCFVWKVLISRGFRMNMMKMQKQTVN